MFNKPLHLNPVASFFPTILLPGDPARAMAIAQNQTDQPLMFNHRRGLWGYSGTTPEGLGLIVQSTGMGGPSAAIICEELADLGATTFLRVGTCGALDERVQLGDLVIVEQALCTDGTSQLLGGVDVVAADDNLIEALKTAAESVKPKFHVGTIASVDLFYDPIADQRHAELLAKGALAIEMEAATVLTVGRERGVRSACLLGVTDVLHQADGRSRLSDDEIVELGELLGAVGVAAVQALG